MTNFRQQVPKILNYSVLAVRNQTANSTDVFKDLTVRHSAVLSCPGHKCPAAGVVYTDASSAWMVGGGQPSSIFNNNKYKNTEKKDAGWDICSRFLAPARLHVWVICHYSWWTAGLSRVGPLPQPMTAGIGPSICCKPHTWLNSRRWMYRSVYKNTGKVLVL